MNGSLVDTLVGLSREFDGLLPIVRGVGGGELLGAQRVLEALSRKVLAAQAELDAAAAAGGVCAEHGYGSVRAMVADVHRLGPREATAREARREQLASRRSITGEVLPPRLPATAAALAEGAIGAAHVETITQVMRQLPASLDPQTCALVEQQLAGFARDFSPRETGILAAQLIARLDPDGPEPTDPEVAPRPDNTLYFGRSRRGRCTLTGEFDTAGEAALRAVIDALATPAPPIDGVRDERSLAARQGDALVEAACQVLGFGDLPDCGGARPQLTITVGLDELERRLAGAMLDYGNALHPETARMLACDRPASFCDGHHLRHWIDGGPTNLSNLLLLCRRHHVLVHRPGWDIHLDPDGHPVFTPPGVIDP